jgi:F-type H+-transporting ATPase subunit delta
MKITKTARREARQLFRSCFVNGVLDDKRVGQAVSEVADAKPRGFLAILSHFHRLVKLEIERRTARIDTAVPLPDQLADSIKSNLSRIYGPGLIFSFSQNPALIGGLRVRVGSDVYDGSIQSSLERLVESF